MRNLLHNFYRISLWVLLSSCIAEDLPPCASGLWVTIGVKDKNYFNIEQFETFDKIDENQPFPRFINTLYYELCSLPTGEIVRKSILTQLVTKEPTYSFLIGNLPEGEYRLTVWGNSSPDDTADQLHPGQLHPSQQEETDLYLGGKRFKMPDAPSFLTLEMERTKGKLLLFCRNFPAAGGRLEAEAGPVYRQVAPCFTYSGQTEVKKKISLSATEEILLAPSPMGKTTFLRLGFYPATSSQSPLALPPTAIAIRRNEVTAVTVDYNSQANYWEIWTFVNGKWTMVHHLDIY